jgi:DNA-binding transcriptional LysR family regulator
MRGTDWDDLRFFIAVTQGGSIAAAARQLATNHSTVLRRLASLERAVGQRLFKRLRTGYRLTSAGEELRERLAGVAEQIESAQRHLESPGQRVLRVTSTDTLMQGILMPLLAKFRSANPAIRLQLVVNNAFLSLTRQEADVAIRPSNDPPGNLIGRRAGYIETAAYASRKYWNARGKQLDACDWIVPAPSLAHLAQARWAEQHIPAERISVTADSLVGMRDAVKAGLGAAMLLTFLADGDSELLQIQPPDPGMNTDVWILTHADLKQDPVVRSFTRFMFDALRASGAVQA